MSSVAYTVAPVKGVCTTYPSKTPVETRLPACFNDHNAPRSVVKLFTGWVSAADTTLNGVISINRQRQRYSHTTASKAIDWLLKHRLVMRVEQGGGRGVGSRYFIRWSFNHETLTQRRRAAYAEINAEKPAGYRITGNPYMYAEGVFKALEEKHESPKRSLDKSKTTYVVPFLENSKREALAKANSQRRQLRNEKAVRWAMARLREATDYEDALTAAAKAIRRSLANGQVFIGPEFNQFVALLAEDLENLVGEEAWPVEVDPEGDPEGRRDVFSFVGHYVQSDLFSVIASRKSGAEYQQRERERQEAQEHPLSELLAEEGVESISQLIRRQANAEGTPQLVSRDESGSRQVATAGAVVRSDNRERRQQRKAYQHAKDLQGALYGEHAARVYGEPASIGDMMSGYLEKLERTGEKPTFPTLRGNFPGIFLTGN